MGNYDVLLGEDLHCAPPEGTPKSGVDANQDGIDDWFLKDIPEGGPFELWCIDIDEEEFLLLYNGQVWCAACIFLGGQNDLVSVDENNNLTWRNYQPTDCDYIDDSGNCMGDGILSALFYYYQPATDTLLISHHQWHDDIDPNKRIDDPIGDSSEFEPIPLCGPVLLHPRSLTLDQVRNAAYQIRRFGHPQCQSQGATEPLQNILGQAGGPLRNTLSLLDNPGCSLSLNDINNEEDRRFIEEILFNPVARCQSVTKSAGNNCQATVTPQEVDNGSFDLNSNSITLILDPPGPFPLGMSTVMLTVTDDDGKSDICIATVKVVDTTPPTVSCSVSQSALPSLWPPNHDLVNVGLSVSATDNCDANLTITVEVFGDEDDEEPTGDGTHSPDAKDIAPGTLRLRSERKADADGRVYLIVVKATDDAGKVGVACCTVVVPKSQSQADVNAVNAQAASARSYCLANNGAPPPGYFVIGDGPIIGPRQ
jgi:hypothetical protein